MSGPEAAPKSGLSLGRRLMIMAASAFATLFVAFMVVGLWGLWSYQGPGPVARSGEATVVVLRQGAGLSEIAAALEREGVVRSNSMFSAAAQISGQARRLKAGEYAFPSRASMAEVLAKIVSGKVVRHFVTIPEGTPSEMAVDLLMAEPLLSGVVAAPPEGALLPETYEFQRGEERAAVMERMIAAQEALLAELWAQRQPNLPIATPQEAVILASIVEKETGVASERPRVAAVFTNRLRLGMRLQSDPTIIYGITRGRPLGRGIRRSELLAQTPYNTYQIDGLPPTPISNPGRASLAAVLDPPKTNEIFFVADGTGGHAFAATLAEHEANVARWRRIERGAAPNAPAAEPVPEAEMQPDAPQAEAAAP